MRTLSLTLTLAFSVISWNGAFARGEELDAVLKAWETGASRVNGRIAVGFTLRQFIAVEKTTDGAVIVGRPSMSLGQPSPTRLDYRRLGHQNESKGKIAYHLDNDLIRLDASSTAPVTSSAKRYSGSWNGGWWEEGTDELGLVPAEFGQTTIRQPFGLLYTNAYRDARLGLRFVELIRQRPSILVREGDLLKIHAPAKLGVTGESPHYTFWLSPMKGMQPVRWESGFQGGSTEIRVENRFDELKPGFWVLTRFVAKMFVADPSSPLLKQVVFESFQEVDQKTSNFVDSFTSSGSDHAELTAVQPRSTALRWTLALAITLAFILLAGITWRRHFRRKD